MARLLVAVDPRDRHPLRGVPAGAYSDFTSQIAAHGVVVVAIDRAPKLALKINYTELAESMDPVVDYVSGGKLAAALRLRQAAGPPNASTLLLAGHSAGNHIITRRLVSFGCGATGGIVLIDPVDGEDPYGFVKQWAEIAVHIACEAD